MDAEGKLIFNVNDFDEAYIGPFTWDLKRLAAALALLGYAKSLSDEQITRLVRSFAKAYRKRIHFMVTAPDKAYRFNLRTVEGPLLDALQSARQQSRIDILDSLTEIREAERCFKMTSNAQALDDATKKKLAAAFEQYLTTLLAADRRSTCRVKDAIRMRGVGIGSAGLPTYNLLVEGATEALENDVVIYIKQSQPSAVSRYFKDEAARKYFKYEGYRTVISQRALQAHANPWAGWTEVDGVGYIVSEVSPYEVDFD